MKAKVSRGAAWALLVISAIWSAGTIGPLLYTLLFPLQDVQHIVRALQGGEALSADVAPLAQGVIDSAGQMRRAIQVGAYWNVSVNYSLKESHKTKATQLSYLAWFDKRSGPTILMITRTETDSSRLRYDIGEGDPLSTLFANFLPVLVLAISLVWVIRSRSGSSR